MRAWAFLPGSGSDTLAPAGPSVGGQAGQPVFSRQRASDGSASAPSAPGGARAALGGSTGVPNEEESRTSSVGSVRDEGLEEAMPKVAGARRERKKRVKRASTPVTSRRGEGAGRGTDLLTRHIWGMRPGTRFRLEPVGTMSLAANVEPLSLWVPAVGPAVVGAVRASGSDIVVDVPFVSGVHARVEVVDRGGKLFLVVADLGSTNGTLVNRGRIRPHLDVTLRPGDILSLGDQDISFRVFAHSPSAEEIPEGDPALDAVLREASGSGESGDEVRLGPWACLT